MEKAESRLPDELLSRATLRGNEFAWPVEAIPEVIEAARAAGLVNIGGQLQLRFPDGATCEAYWVEVDTLRSAPAGQNWPERVAWSAREALSQFRLLQSTHDFKEEGKKACPNHGAGFLREGDVPSDAVCFVWYIEAQSGKPNCK